MRAALRAKWRVRMPVWPYMVGSQVACSSVRQQRERATRRASSWVMTVAGSAVPMLRRASPGSALAGTPALETPFTVTPGRKLSSRVDSVWDRE